MMQNQHTLKLQMTLFIQADYDGDDTNKAIYLDTGGSRTRARHKSTTG